MPINASHFTIHTSTKVISYIGPAHGVSGASYATVLELHRWLQDLADDSGASGDDFMDISRATPSDKQYDTIVTLVNGYTIDIAASEHLYGGSIIQGSGGTEEIYDGIQVIAGSGCHVEIVQSVAGVATVLTNDFWNSIPFGTGIKGLNPDTSNGIACRFMIKVRTGGADIDGRRLLLQTREFGYTYSEFKLNGTGRGINVAALTYAPDLNNATLEATIAAIADISNLTTGYNGIVVNGTVTAYFYSKWDRGVNSINTFYERMKWLTRRGSASTLYGLNGELFRGITHQITVDTPSTTDFSATEAVSWTGGTGQMLAIDDVNAPTMMWLQLLTGVAPTDNQTITGGTSGATCLVNITVTERALSYPFCGASTGSAIIGAIGFGIEVADLAVNDKLFDLTNNLRQPQNLVTFTVSGLYTDQDYLLVGPGSSGTLLESQFTINGALSGAAVTSVVVNGSIPADTPPTGFIRIMRTASGAFSRHAYTSWTGSTFTIASTNFSANGVANGANAYIGYLDALAASTPVTAGSFVASTQYIIVSSGTTNFTLIGAANSSPGTIFTATGVGTGTGTAKPLVTSASFQTSYVSNRELYVRRRAGISSSPTKTFETAATLGSAGGSVAVQRLSDA